jgi:GDP-L-fucose synthase
VNLGNGQEITIRDLAAKIAKASRYEGRFVWDTSKPNGQPRRRLDVTRAQERFGFVAKTTFDDGLRSTVSYYENHQEEIEHR